MSHSQSFSLGFRPAKPSPQNAKSPPKLRTSCDPCRTAKVRCISEDMQCARCTKHGMDCSYSPSMRMGKPRAAHRAQHAKPSSASFVGDSKSTEIAHHRNHSSASSGNLTSPTSTPPDSFRPPSQGYDQPLFENFNQGTMQVWNSYFDDNAASTVQQFVTDMPNPTLYVPSENQDMLDYAISGIPYEDAQVALTPTTQAFSPYPFTPISMDGRDAGLDSLGQVSPSGSSSSGPAPLNVNPPFLFDRAAPTYPDSRMETGSSCPCEANLLHALQSIVELSKTESPPFDVTLSTNKEGLVRCSSMLRCPSCPHRSTSVMVLSALMSRIINLYRSVCAAYSISPSPRAARRQGDLVSDTRGLTLGTFKVDKEDERVYRRGIVLIELQKFNSLLLGFRNLSSGVEGRVKYGTYEALLRHVSQELRSAFDMIQAQC